ncbi:hypothetical protein KKF19_03265 [Patescibacteria group bacterium]|nr:hypothetical protein [Patescibacteria group bacterium]
MRYFIIILFIFIFSFGTASAGDKELSGWADSNYQKISNYAKHIFDFVKQKTDSIPREIDTKAEEVLEDAQEKITKKAEQATEEIKEKIKERIKSKIINTFNPLKTKIQQGSALIREQVGQAKDYLFNWLEK